VLRRQPEPLLKPADFARLRKLIRDESLRLRQPERRYVAPPDPAAELASLNELVAALNRLELSGRI